MISWQVLFPTVAAVIWAGSPIAAKMAVGAIDPFQIAFLRWFIALVILTPFVIRGIVAERKRIIGKLPHFVVLGLLGMVVYQSLAYFAVRYTTVGNIGLIDVTIPMFVTIIEMLMTRRLQPARVLLGCTLAFVGIAFLVTHEHDFDYKTFSLNLGDGLMIVSCLSYAFYSVFISRLSVEIRPWHALYMQIASAVLILLPFYLTSKPITPSIESLPILLYVGVLSSIVAPYAWMLGVNALGSARTSVFLNLVPVLTLGVAVTALGESLSTGEIVGGSLGVLGVVISQYKTLPS